MEPNGKIVNNDSRRQDQFIGMNVLPFYLDYRHIALHDNNANFTTISKQIEQTKGFDEKIIPDLLAFFTEDPDLCKTLPKPAILNTNFEQFFKTKTFLRSVMLIVGSTNSLSELADNLRAPIDT